jgi:hypothetical protein
MTRSSRLAEVRQDRIDELESLIDLFADLGTREYDLAGDEDKQDDLGLHHTVDETREELRLVGRESVMARCKTLQTDGELDIAGSDDVLNLKVLQSC